VDNGAVGLRGTTADILRLFHYTHPQLIAGEIPGRGTAHHTGSHDYNIIHRFLSSQRKKELHKQDAVLLHPTCITLLLFMQYRLVYGMIIDEPPAARPEK
jgi:hypothetical protein